MSLYVYIYIYVYTYTLLKCTPEYHICMISRVKTALMVRATTICRYSLLGPNSRTAAALVHAEANMCEAEKVLARTTPILPIPIEPTSPKPKSNAVSPYFTGHYKNQPVTVHNVGIVCGIGVSVAGNSSIEDLY